MHPLPPADRPAVRLDAAPDLAAALPHLLGFVPHESLVLVALTGSRGTRVGVTVRVDLPAAGALPAAVAGAVARLGPEPPVGVVGVVVSEDADDELALHVDDLLDLPLDHLDDAGWARLIGGPTLPHRPVAEELTRVLDEAGVPLLDLLLVRDGRCWSYGCAAPCCHPHAGVPLPGGTTPLAAAAVLTGQVVAADRDEVVARLARPTGPGVVAMSRACAEVGAEQAGSLARDGWDLWSDRAWQVVGAAVDSCGPGRVAALSDAEVARVAWAVGDLDVRDRALGLGAGPRAAAAESLWTELVRRLPSPLDAAPATLLAALAWARGDGTTAGIALDRALTSQPSYALARLLADGLAVGLPPSEVAGLLARAGERSEQLGA